MKKIKRKGDQVIDGIKILSLPIKVRDLLRNPLLLFSINAFHTGEENAKNQCCDYYSLLLIINQVRKTRKLMGSLHKYWNGGAYNYNDFYFLDVVMAIQKLCADLKVDPKYCKLNNLEYGINLITDFDPTDMINDLIQHGGKPFIRLPEGDGVSCRHSQYTIKIYNKGKQYDLPYYVLRIEIRVEAMDYFRSKGFTITTLADLMDIEKHKLLGQDLLARFNEILFFDSTIDMESLETSNQLILSNGRNPKYWKDLSDKNKVDLFRRKYNQLYKTHGKRNWKQIVSPLIRNKIDDLIYGQPPSQEQYIQNNEPSSLMKIKTPVETILEISSSVPEQEFTSPNLAHPELPSSSAVKNVHIATSLYENNKISSSVFEKESPAEFKDFTLVVQSPEIWVVLELEEFFKYALLPDELILDSYGVITDPRSFIREHLDIIDCHYREPAYQDYYDRLIEIGSQLSRRVELNKH